MPWRSRGWVRAKGQVAGRICLVEARHALVYWNPGSGIAASLRGGAGRGHWADIRVFPHFIAGIGILLTRNWQLWLGLGVSTALLLVLVYRVDLAEMADALAGANYVYVIPAIALYFVAVYFRALRWRFLLSPIRQIPVGRLYPVVVIGYMANNLLPARLGELVRSYYLARREQVSGSSALATVAVERVYDGLTLLAFAALAGPLLLLMGEFDGTSDTSRATWIVLAGLIVALFVGALVFLTLLATTPRFIEFFYRTLSIVPARFRPKIRALVGTFVDGLSVLSSPRKHLELLFLSVPVWLLEGSMYFLIAYSFGIDEHLGSVGALVLAITLLTATSNLVTALPTAIGGIGPFELVAQQTLMAMGVGASVAGVYAAFVHLVALWLPVNLVGLAILWKQNLSLKGLAGKGLTGAPQGGYAAQGSAAGHAAGAGQFSTQPAKEDLP